MADVAETIEQSARRTGHHAWLEMRLFEILGRWSGTVAEPRARVLFATHSQHHAWHAELWHGLLPALPHLAAADLVAPDEADAAVVAALETLDDAATEARLTAIYGDTLPHVARSYGAHLALTTPVTDGPAIRALRLALADLDADLAAGEALVAALSPEADVDRGGGGARPAPGAAAP